MVLESDRTGSESQGPTPLSLGLPTSAAGRGQTRMHRAAVSTSPLISAGLFTAITPAGIQ